MQHVPPEKSENLRKNRVGARLLNRQVTRVPDCGLAQRRLSGVNLKCASADSVGRHRLLGDSSLGGDLQDRQRQFHCARGRTGFSNYLNRNSALIMKKRIGDKFDFLPIKSYSVGAGITKADESPA